MNLDEDITQKDLCDLLSYFSKQTYSASSSDEKARRILDRCIDLFMKDYEISLMVLLDNQKTWIYGRMFTKGLSKVGQTTLETLFQVNQMFSENDCGTFFPSLPSLQKVLTNGNGELCGHYPQRIIIIESEILRGEQLLTDGLSVKINDISQLKPLIKKARLARCRSRFVAPVISFDGKNICRSATLSSFAEIVGRSGFNFLFSSPVFPDDQRCEESNSEWDLVHQSRCQDIQLLKTLHVKYIFDLMLENKKVKYGMRITSSEKIDKENRYAEFCLCCIPYPGCEFFRILKTKDYLYQRVYFDWTQDYVDADLNLPDEIEMQVDCRWDRYQRWDLATLTKNYFLLLLKTILNSDDGILVHCISGWDRTPLFISLLRLSLWADGKVHQSLNALEILYLTVGYDWLLFGHDLNDRMQRDEEVFFFCFHFLQYIMSDVYSVTQLSRSNNEASQQTSESNVTPATAPEEQLCSDSTNDDMLSQSTCRGFFIGEQTSNEEHTEEPDSSSSGSIPSVHHNGSTPLPVPNSVTNQAQCQNSLSAGSWQLVSGPASLCSNAGSDGFYSNLAKRLGEYGNSLSSCEEAIEDSVRRTRLETVRSLFLNVYNETLGDCEDQPSNVTFSKLFNHVTDKLKPPWGR